MRRPYKIVAIVIALIVATGFYRYRWAVLGVVGIGPRKLACGDVAALQAYLDTGGDPSAFRRRIPFIMCAAEAGNTAVVTELIEAGADVNAQKAPPLLPAMDATTGMTALYVAVEKEHPEIVKLLVEAGADINISGPGTHSPLNAAISDNRVEILEIFLGADINDGYEFNSSAIGRAASRGYIDVFRLLLEYEIQLENGYEGVLRAAEKNRHSNIVNLLVENGIRKESDISD